jgi:methionyl-tRNA formyltransferase
MDTGSILLQEETEISEHDTAGSLSRRLSKIGADLLIPTLRGLENGDLQPRPQRGEASYAPILKKTDGLIQWSQRAEEICRMIRGMNPWPGAYGFLGEERIKIFKALSLEGEGIPGVIDTATKDRLIVGTGKGKLSVLEIQPAGKSVMAVKSFLQGRKLKEGEMFHAQGV